MNDGCDAWFWLCPPAQLQPLRTYFRGPNGIGAFEVEQIGSFPIKTAIEMVRNDMKTNAMVLIK